MSADAEPITIWAPTTINQTSRDRLKEMIRADGILVDLDEDDVLDEIVDFIISHADPETEVAKP